MRRESRQGSRIIFRATMSRGGRKALLQMMRRQKRKIANGYNRAFAYICASLPKKLEFADVKYYKTPQHMATRPGRRAHSRMFSK